MTDRVAADLRSSFEEGLGQVRCLLDALGVDYDQADLLVTYPTGLPSRGW